MQIRVGLNSGEVVVRCDRQRSAAWTTRRSGQTTHLAARMEQLAEPGHDPAHRRDAAPGRGLRRGRRRSARCRSRGSPSPVEVFELTGAGVGPHAPPGRGAPGAHALRRPRRGAGAAPPRPRAGGPAGTARSSPWSASRASGKSRLFWEFTHSHRVHGWLVLASRLGLLRQGHGLPARHRAAPRLLRDRGAATTRGRSARRSRARS